MNEQRTLSIGMQLQDEERLHRRQETESTASDAVTITAVALSSEDSSDDDPSMINPRLHHVNQLVIVVNNQTKKLQISLYQNHYQSTASLTANCSTRH